MYIEKQLFTDVNKEKVHSIVYKNHTCKILRNKPNQGRENLCNEKFKTPKKPIREDVQA